MKANSLIYDNKMQNTDTMEEKIVYADLWTRFFCLCIDNLITLLITIPILVVFIYTDLPRYIINDVVSFEDLRPIFIVFGILLRWSIDYYFLVKYSATFGQIALNVKTLDEITHSRITSWQAFKKLLFFIVSRLLFERFDKNYYTYFWIVDLIVFIIDIFLIIFHKKRQTLEDMFAGTVVVIRPRN